MGCSIGLAAYGSGIVILILDSSSMETALGTGSSILPIITNPKELTHASITNITNPHAPNHNSPNP
jgi:hypothetical protein